MSYIAHTKSYVYMLIFTHNTVTNPQDCVALMVASGYVQGYNTNEHNRTLPHTTCDYPH